MRERKQSRIHEHENEAEMFHFSLKYSPEVKNGDIPACSPRNSRVIIGYSRVIGYLRVIF
jgi:hypothetical protein